MEDFDVQFEDNDESETSDSNDGSTPETPFSTKNIKVNTQTIALSTLITRLKYSEIDLQPSFQRNSGLWTNSQMSRLIESILLKMPLPIFYFDVAAPDKWLVVDGLQRLSAIRRFAVPPSDVAPSADCKPVNPLKLTNLEFLTDLNGKGYKDLPRPMQRVIDETQVVTYQIEPQTPKEVRYSIFNRINTGGLKLNAQEIRQALNQKGVAVNFLKEICDSTVFKEVVNIQTERMLDRELVLRFFAFRLLKVDESFKGLSPFLDRAMEEIDKDITISPQLALLKQEFEDALRMSEELLGSNHKFSKAITGKGKNSLNRSLFDVLTVSLSLVKDKKAFCKHENQFKEELINMIADETSLFSQAIFQGTSSKRAVVDRFTEMNQLIKKIENRT